jgi:glyoxylase-like metal-dependent hydrolase (beta-lactamase superfamily II)
MSETMRVSGSRGRGSPRVAGFYEPVTGSIQYVASDPATLQAVIIDAVWDFDRRCGRTSTHSAERLLRYVSEEGLAVVEILDTHPHADHFMAARVLKEHLDAPTAIGEHVKQVQDLWKEIYDLPGDFPADGSQWDRLYRDGDPLSVGALEARVIFSPGHTLASVSYLVGDALFCHDTFMQPDSGTSRCDFPGGDAAALHRTLQRLLELPGDTRTFVGHDYGKDGREPAWEATIDEQRRENTHLKGGVTETEFVARRQARDATLPLPELMLHALQVNICGGRLPEPEGNGTSYLRIPVNRF